MGLFVTLAEPTAPMKKEAASSGVLDTQFGKFARLQILTIKDLFAGKKPAMPPQDQRSCSAFCSKPPSSRPSNVERIARADQDHLALIARAHKAG